MALFKRSKTKKIQSIDQLLTEFSNEKDKDKKISICDTIYSNLDQYALSKTISDQLIKGIASYEKSSNSKELTIWTKIMIELSHSVANHKISYQSRILATISSSLFNDNQYKLNFINALTNKGKEIIGISNPILSSFIEFIVFNNILKEKGKDKEEDNEELLTLLQNFINKISPINIEGYLINFIVDTLCLLAYNYTIRSLCIPNKEENDKATKKILICIQILEACLDDLQIMKKNIISIVFFIVILFNFKEPNIAHGFCIKLVLQCGRLFEKELIDLLNDKTIIKHLNRLDKILINDCMLFQFIFQFNGDTIKSVSNDYMNFQRIYKPDKKQLNEIIIITQISALRLIKELCWQNDLNKFGEFKIPKSIILNSILLLSGNVVFFIEIIENLEMFIKNNKRYSIDEWEYAFDIINQLINNINADLLIESSSNSNSNSSFPLKSYQSAPINSYQHLSSTDFNVVPLQSLLLNHIESLYHPSLIIQKTKIEELLKGIINLCIKQVFIGNVDRITSSLLLFTSINDDFLSLCKIKLTLSNIISFPQYIESAIEQNVLKSKSNIVKIAIFDSIRNYYYNTYNKQGQALVIEKLIQLNHMKIIEAHINNTKMLIAFSSFIVFMISLTCNNEFFLNIINHLFTDTPLDTVNTFQRKTLQSIINKLIRGFEKNKLSFFNIILSNQIKFLQANTEKLEQNSNLIKNIIYIFKYFYINEFNEIEIKLDNHRRRLFSYLRSNYDEIKQAESKYTSINKENYGYLPLNFNDFYSFALYLIQQNEHNSFVFSELLALINKQLRHLFFFKHLDIMKIILTFSNQLLSPNYILKYLNKEIIIKQITQLFINLNFHFNTNLLNLLPIEDRMDKEEYKTLLDIYDPHSSMKSNIISLIISVVTPMIALSNQFIVIETRRLTISKSMKDDIAVSKPLIPTDLCSNGISFEMNLVFINQFISLLESYLFSLIGWKPKEKSLNTFFSTKNRNETIEQHKTVIYGSNELVSNINGFLKILRKSKALIGYNYDFAFVLLKSIFAIKELLLSFGEEKKIEVIYLILCIVWPGYEKELTEAFKWTYKFGFLNEANNSTNVLNDKKETTEDKLKRMLLIEWFGDIVIMFFIEKIKTGNQLLNIFQKVFNKPNDNREVVFIELAKWTLIFQRNRDNLLRNSNSNAIKQSQMINIEAYYDNWNLITLNKIAIDSHKVTIRNALSNISLTIKSPSSIWKEEKDQMTTLENLINNNTVTSSQSNQHNSNQQLSQREFSYNSIFRTLSKTNFTNNQIDISSLANEINQLDLLTVYTVISCGIIFYPDIHQITDSQLMMYNGKVSIPYLQFINSLGHTMEISDKNSNIFLMGQAHSGKEGKYAIYHQDTMFQIIFHCSNLIITSDKGEIGDIRKKILGNNYINVIWMDNCYMKFTPSTIKTKKTFVYIVIYPYSASHYYVKLKFQSLNNETDQLMKEKQNIIEMIKKFMQTKVVIYVDKDCFALSNYIKKLVIIATSLIEYNIEKMAYCDGKAEVCNGNAIHRNTLLFRYQELINHLIKNKD